MSTVQTPDVPSALHTAVGWEGAGASFRTAAGILYKTDSEDRQVIDLSRYLPAQSIHNS